MYLTKNNAYSTLAGSITDSATSITVQVSHGDRFPVVAGSDYSYVTIEDASGNREIVKVTARASGSDTLTVVRNQEASIAKAFASGSIVSLRPTAGLFSSIFNHLLQAVGAHKATAISVAAAGSFAAGTVQSILAYLDSLISSVTSALSTHLSDTSDAHDASAISYLGNTNLASTDVEAALDELDNEKAALAGATFTGAINEKQGANIASAATINLTTATGNYTHVTGTTPITAITLAQGARRTVVFEGVLTLTNGANLLLPSWADITTAAGDAAVFIGDAAGVVRCVNYMRKNGLPVISASEVGFIKEYGGVSPPAGYLACPLTLTNISRSTYSALFAAIGTTWGAGDGSTTFGLPFFPADYASVQANGNVGTNHVGEVIAHTHLQQSNTAIGTGSDYTLQSGGSPWSYGGTTQSTGGAANYAAGVRVLKCIKY